MKNVLDERPTDERHGLHAWVRDFVLPADYRGRDVLDVGCGFGWFELAALERGARSVVGIEPDAAGLETARRHVARPGVELRVAGATDLPFGDASFDTVAMWEVLEHLPKGSEPRALAEIARVLRDGGALYLSTPHTSLRARLTDPAWWLIGHRHYAPARVAELAEAAGLRVEALETKGGWWQILHVNDLYASKWILRRRPLFERPVVRRVDREWERPGGFAHVVLRARK